LRPFSLFPLVLGVDPALARPTARGDCLPPSRAIAELRLLSRSALFNRPYPRTFSLFFDPLRGFRTIEDGIQPPFPPSIPANSGGPFFFFPFIAFNSFAGVAVALPPLVLLRRSPLSGAPYIRVARTHLSLPPLLHAVGSRRPPPLFFPLLRKNRAGFRAGLLPVPVVINLSPPPLLVDD